MLTISSCTSCCSVSVNVLFRNRKFSEIGDIQTYVRPNRSMPMTMQRQWQQGCWLGHWQYNCNTLTVRFMPTHWAHVHRWTVEVATPSVHSSHTHTQTHWERESTRIHIHNGYNHHFWERLLSLFYYGNIMGNKPFFIILFIFNFDINNINRW